MYSDKIIREIKLKSLGIEGELSPLTISVIKFFNGNLNYLNIKDFPMLIRGEEDKGLKQVKKLLQTSNRGSCAFINAKGDFKYSPLLILSK